jgi:hypothetical protein
MTDEQRKASDVIVAIEDKLNTLLQSMSVYNLNIKLILDRVNKVYNYINQLEAQSGIDTASPPPSTDKDVVQTSAEHVITVDSNPTGVRRTARAESYAPAPQPPIQDVKKSGQPDRKVPVSQRLTNRQGKDLFMAEVEILNDKKELVQSTKTNATGKWQAHLKPGKYHIHVIKTDTATKDKIEAWQELNIPFSDTVVTLPTAIIKKPDDNGRI